MRGISAGRRLGPVCELFQHRPCRHESRHAAVAGTRPRNHRDPCRARAAQAPGIDLGIDGGRIAQVLTDFGDHVEFRNTWGDAVYAVIDEPKTAASIALALQEQLAEIPPNLVPEGAIAGMRLGLHYGPIWVGTDRITGNRLWYGGEVNRTARIEPVTPVGGVYCTESFAAALLMANCNDCTFTSVGRVLLPKNYGEVELYRLERGPTPGL